MAEIQLSYGSLTHLRVINVTYDDATHLITASSIGEVEIGSGLSPGAEFYRQTVGDDFWSLRVLDGSPYAYVVHGSTAITCDLTIDDTAIVAAMNGAGGSLTVTASGTGTKRYDIGFGPQVSNVFSNLLPGPYVLILSRTEDLCEARVVVTIPNYPDLEILATPTDCTVNGANDGKILLQVLAGSGDYSANFVTEGVVVLLEDGNVEEERINLAPGSYEIEVTDTLTGQVRTTTVTIADPALNVTDPQEGSVFRFSPANSIRFVIENDAEEQTLDNKLYCNQYQPGYDRSLGASYYQKLQTTDGPIVLQFDSNFSAHTVELKDFKTGAVVDTFSATIKEHNVGSTIEYPVLLKDHTTPGKTRVYFTQGAFQIPIVVGTKLEIQNNGDGMDGNYQVTEIALDEDMGYEYMLINLAYAGGLTSPADGLFQNAALDFNVWEFSFDCDQDEGIYFIQITPIWSGISQGVDSSTPAVSEPINLKTVHRDTLGIIYSCDDNAFGLTFTTGYRGFVRIPSRMFKRFPGGDTTIVRDNRDNIIKIRAKRRRVAELEVIKIPPYLHELLALVFGCDFFSINGVAFQTEGDYPEPKYLDKFGLSNVSVRVEQLNWFPTYNSVGVSSESCVCENLDLVKVPTGTSTITLDMKRKVQRYFSGTPAIDGDRTIALSNDGLALSWKFRFTMDAPHEITFPDNSTMSAAEWDDSAKTWTPVEPGERMYEIEAMFDGSNWLLKTASFPVQS